MSLKANIELTDNRYIIVNGYTIYDVEEISEKGKKIVWCLFRGDDFIDDFDTVQCALFFAMGGYL